MVFTVMKKITQNGERTKVMDGYEIFEVASDGQEINIYRSDKPSDKSQKKATYFHSQNRSQLPREYWNKYNYAVKWVQALRGQTPKITKYTSTAVCRLMENGPDPSFEMTFYASQVRFSYDSAKGIRIFEPSSNRVDQYALQTRELDPSHDYAREFKQFLSERETAMALDNDR